MGQRICSRAFTIKHWVLFVLFFQLACSPEQSVVAPTISSVETSASSTDLQNDNSGLVVYDESVDGDLFRYMIVECNELPEIVRDMRCPSEMELSTRAFGREKRLRLNAGTSVIKGFAWTRTFDPFLEQNGFTVKANYADTDMFIVHVPVGTVLELDRSMFVYQNLSVVGDALVRNVRLLFEVWKMSETIDINGGDLTRPPPQFVSQAGVLSDGSGLYGFPRTAVSPTTLSFSVFSDKWYSTPQPISTLAAGQYLFELTPNAAFLWKQPMNVERTFVGWNYEIAFKVRAVR